MRDYVSAAADGSRRPVRYLISSPSSGNVRYATGLSEGAENTAGKLLKYCRLYIYNYRILPSFTYMQVHTPT